jgi:hypothetical protein
VRNELIFGGKRKIQKNLILFLDFQETTEVRFFLRATNSRVKLTVSFGCFGSLILFPSVTTMEVLISVDNFEEPNGRYREINSPRTLEACLRTGLDPTELYPRSKTEFKDGNISKEMLDIKYGTFQSKREGKVPFFFLSLLYGFLSCFSLLD